MQEKLRILFVSANPRNTDKPLSIGKERKQIEKGLEKYEGKFEFMNWDEVESKDLGPILQKFKPHILHFSGHASEDHGIPIFLNKDDGEIVPSEAFVTAMSLYKDNLKCIFLNACYTYKLSKEIGKYIDCVIGSEGKLGDEAIDFSSKFYSQIFEDDVLKAFNKTKNHLEMQKVGLFQINFSKSYDDVRKLYLFRNSKDELHDYLTETVVVTKKFMNDMLDRYFPDFKGRQTIVSIDYRNAEYVETHDAWNNDILFQWNNDTYHYLHDGTKKQVVFVNLLKEFLMNKKDLKMVIGAPFGTGKTFLASQIVIKFAEAFKTDDDYVPVLVKLGDNMPFNLACTTF